MTLESLHFADTAPEQESNETLITKRLEASREIGRLSLELAQISQEYKDKITQLILLNQELANRGIDRHALAQLIQTPLPHEESYLFSGSEDSSLKAVSGF